MNTEMDELTCVSYAVGDLVTALVDSEDNESKIEGLITDVVMRETLEGTEIVYGVSAIYWMTLSFNAMALVRRASTNSLIQALRERSVQVLVEKQDVYDSSPFDDDEEDAEEDADETFLIQDGGENNVEFDR